MIPLSNGLKIYDMIWILFLLPSMKRGFTLVELLIVIGILVVLGVVVVLILNPAQIFKESRDAKRVNDLASLNNAIRVAASLGLDDDVVIDIVYISLPSDNADCSDLTLPDIAPLTYQCVPEADVRNIDGTGWVPIDFTQLSTAGVSLPTIPIDPVNTDTSGLYYTYQKGSWLVSTLMESLKYQIQLACVYTLQSSGASSDGLTAPDHGQDEDCGVAGGGGGGGGGELIAHWELDEGSGTIAADSTANNNDGTLTNGPTWSTDTPSGTGYSLSFDGSNDYVSADDSGMPLGDSNRTISLWIKLNAVDNYFGLLRYGTAVPLEHSALVVNPGGSLSYSGHSNDFTGPSTITAEEWHHVVFTYSSGGDAKLYLDGDLYTSATISAQDTVSGGTLVIGAYDDEGPGHPKLFFSGLMDDVRIYDGALSASQIQNLYNNP